VTRPKLKHALLSTTLLGLLVSPVLLAAPALAQTAQAEDDDVVVVTGTRISPAKAMSPQARSTTINAEELAVKQPTDVEDVLRAMPQFLARQRRPGEQRLRRCFTSVDLRGLTTPRTLPLIDGKRMVGYDPNGVFDVTAVPLSPCLSGLMS
jgi:iron complex outermembrane receptor protein